jgi:hypothetical protein
VRGTKLILAMTLAVAALLASAAPASAAGPSGDPATIAFYRTVVAATAKRGGILMRVSGYTSLYEARTGYFRWLDGEATPPSYVPAVDQVTIASAHGKLVWLYERAVPLPSCSHIGQRTCEGLDLFLGPSGIFYRLGNMSCWSPAHGSVLGYTRPGEITGFALYGHFLPMRRVGNTVYVTSTYPWGKQVATEVDTIPYSTRLPSSDNVHVAAGAGLRAFTSNFTYRGWLVAEPPKPATPACGLGGARG